MAKRLPGRLIHKTIEQGRWRALVCSQDFAMPVIRRQAPEPEPKTNSFDSPFASVAEASKYLKESKRTVRELVARKVFKLALNSNGKQKPWRLLWSEIKEQARAQMLKAS